MLLEYLHQPVVSLSTKQVAGVELLARFNGKATPAETLSHDVNEWLALDIGGLTHIQDNDILSKHHCMAFVNLSRHVARYQWATDAFLYACRQAMEQSSVDIVVDISDEININDEDIVSLAGRIRRMGIRCAMDDHKGLPGCHRRARLDCWDIIKVSVLDRLIDAVCRDVRSLAALCVPVVATSIENAHTMREVEASGASYAQGWHTGVPVPTWISKSARKQVVDEPAENLAAQGGG